MSKQSMREEAERLIRETMARKSIVVKQGNTRIETICGNAARQIASRLKKARPASNSPASNAGTSKRRSEFLSRRDSRDNEA